MVLIKLAPRVKKKQKQPKIVLRGQISKREKLRGMFHNIRDRDYQSL